MDHPNIIKIYETFEDSKSYYVVTEYDHLLMKLLRRRRVVWQVIGGGQL